MVCLPDAFSSEARAFPPPLRALDATNGDIVWEFRTGARGNATPMTYLHDGRQYVAYIATSAANNGGVAFDAARSAPSTEEAPQPARRPG